MSPAGFAGNWRIISAGNMVSQAYFGPMQKKCVVRNKICLKSLKIHTTIPAIGPIQKNISLRNPICEKSGFSEIYFCV